MAGLGFSRTAWFVAFLHTCAALTSQHLHHDVRPQDVRPSSPQYVGPSSPHNVGPSSPHADVIETSPTEQDYPTSQPLGCECSMFLVTSSDWLPEHKVFSTGQMHALECGTNQRTDEQTDELHTACQQYCQQEVRILIYVKKSIE